MPQEGKKEAQFGQQLLRDVGMEPITLHNQTVTLHKCYTIASHNVRQTGHPKQYISCGKKVVFDFLPQACFWGGG